MSGRDARIAAEDALEIFDLIADYAFHYDGERLAEFAALFCEDGRLETALGGGTGHAEIEAWARARWSQMHAEARAPRHFQTNTRLAFAGPDELTGRTQLLLVWVDTASGAPEIKYVADYFDVFRRTDAGWRIAHRSIGIDPSE